MKIETTKQPEFRKLWAYAFDPSLSLQVDTAKINRLSYKVKWEEVTVGPCGEYIEVIDYDPTIKEMYAPVDLNEKYILAEGGLKPSVSNPMFHQQMVYAVAMTTIQNFEQALGRKIIWSPRRVDNNEYEVYVKTLRLYPHALREANAYYSPLRKSILFGYFNSTPANKVLHMPNSLVFTCLSHDIVTHEITHAILDGIHGEFGIPTNPDMLAFHEAFADIVALFQHFTFPEVLKFEIARTKGDLDSENLLAKLAVELGSAIGGYGSLRDAIGHFDNETNKWISKKPNPDDYLTMHEPHDRGGILVGAFFDAFITIYKNRIQDLLRIASNGSGILNEGAIHPDLVNRLAREASKSAKHVLGMCIRALDYCPPVDLNFGDYLRAIITADIDLMKDDSRDYRLAFIEAFRNRGVYPTDIKTLSIETLTHPNLNLRKFEDEDSLSDSNIKSMDEDFKDIVKVIIEYLREYANEVHYLTEREKIFDITKKFIRGTYDQDRRRFQTGLHRKLSIGFKNSRIIKELSGMILNEPYSVFGLDLEDSIQNDAKTSFQIKNLRKVSRVGPDGLQINHIVFSMIQRIGIRFEENNKVLFKPNEDRPLGENEIIFYGGCTFIFDLDTDTLKYIISKPLIDTSKTRGVQLSKRSDNQSKYQNEEMAYQIGESRRYFGTRPHEFAYSEPFAFLHHH